MSNLVHAHSCVHCTNSLQSTISCFTNCSLQTCNLSLWSPARKDLCWLYMWNKTLRQRNQLSELAESDDCDHFQCVHPLSHHARWYTCFCTNASNSVHRQKQFGRYTFNTGCTRILLAAYTVSRLSLLCRFHVIGSDICEANYSENIHRL